MTIAPLLDESCAARVSRIQLAALAPLRRLAGIRIVEAGEEAWITWEGAMPSIVSVLLPVPGVEFFAKAGGQWRPIGGALPDFAVPFKGEGAAIDRVVLPEALKPTAPSEIAMRRVPISLVPCSRPTKTSAMRTNADPLIRWAETATSWEIGQLRGAANGGVVWLFGQSLPVLNGAERFWGRRVLIPLGMRPDPDLPEAALREAAIVDDEEILVLTPDGPEALPVGALQQLTRAAIRRLAP